MTRWGWLELGFMGVALFGCSSGSESTISSTAQTTSSTVIETATTTSVVETTEDPAQIALAQKREIQAEAREVARARLRVPATYLPREAVNPDHGTGRIIELRCALDFCAQVGEGIAQAAALLEWKHEIVVLGDTQDTVEGIWQLISEERPTMVIASATDVSWSGAQVFVDAGVPVLEYGAASDSTSNGVVLGAFGPSEFYRRGVLMADMAVLSGTIPAEISFLSLDEQPLLAVLRQGFEDELELICFEDCALTVDPLSIEESLLGAVLSRVLDEAQIEEPPLLVLPLEALLYGADQALDAYPGGNVRVVTQGPGALVLGLSVSGLEAQSVGVATQALGWHLVDQGIRLSLGLEATPVPLESLAGQEIASSLVPWAILSSGGLSYGPEFLPSPSAESYFSNIWSLEILS